MLIIGVTGGIGTGKTTIAEIFRNLGAVALNADEIAHRIVAPDTVAWGKIRDYFGAGALDKDGRINRRALAEKAFADRAGLDKLCGIIHPLVYLEIGRLIRSIKKTDPGAVVVVDAPLLLESCGNLKVDKLVVVICHRDIQIERAQKRLKQTRAHILRRIRAQMPLKDKMKAADFVVDNNGSRLSAKRQVLKIWRKLTGL
ncbi:MAG: dephospho-CoA kinase [Candidatus Omnitrophota bacterium]